jgi:hypothetical protein
MLFHFEGREKKKKKELTNKKSNRDIVMNVIFQTVPDLT